MRCYKLLICTAICLLCYFQSRAATYTIADGDVTGLTNALLAAGRNVDADVIILATNGTYVLTRSYEDGMDNAVNLGKVGLPTLRGNITIIGNGATIRRAASSPLFRILFMAVSSTLTMENLTIENGSLDQRGCGLYVGFNGVIDFNGVTFKNNIGVDDVFGGALAIRARSVAKLQNCTFTGNAVQTGGLGAGICSVIANLSLTNCTFEGNKGGWGSGVYVDGGWGDSGKVSMVGCTFSKNISESEGGAVSIFLYNSNTALVDKCKFYDNVINLGTKNNAYGGGLWYGEGALRNMSDGWGALTPVATQMTVSNSIFQRNTSKNYGGGVYVGSGSVSINNSVFANNESSTQGGAIWNSSGKIKVTNSTFYQNKALTSSGGAVLNYQGEIDFTNCTLAENSVTVYGGAIDNNLGTISMSNTILQNNVGTLGNNHYRSFATAKFVDEGKNLCFPANRRASGLDLPTTVSLADALLSPLADNGGGTLTMALRAGSPAINAGSNCPPTDQRGVARVGVCDIGAFEYEPPPLPPAPTQLTGEAILPTQINLNWTDNANNETGFKIERSNTAASGFLEIGQTVSDVKTFIDKNLQAGANYFYRVRAFNTAGNSAYSNEFSISTIVGINYIDVSHQLNIYPNPTEERLLLQMDNAMQGNIKIRVTDLLGKSLMEEVWYKHSDKLNKEISMTNLSAGVFMVEITYENYRAVKRIVKY